MTLRRTIGRGLGLIDNGRLLLERDIRQMPKR